MQDNKKTSKYFYKSPSITFRYQRKDGITMLHVDIQKVSYENFEKQVLPIEKLELRWRE